MNSILDGVDVSKPLKEQKKPDYVCEPDDPRVIKYGWRKTRFRGYLSLDDNHTIWVSAIESKFKGRGHFSKLIRALKKDGFIIKVSSPFPRMEAICNHLGFRKEREWFKEANEWVTVMIL